MAALKSIARRSVTAIFGSVGPVATRRLGDLELVRRPAADGEMSAGVCGASGGVVSSTNERLATAERLPNSSAAVKRMLWVPSLSGPPFSVVIAAGVNVKLSP